MHFDVVLSVFIHPCTKKWKRAQFSIHAELTRLSVCVRFRCVCGKLLTQRSTVTPIIPSVFYARLVPSGSPNIESWYVRLNKNACIGGNAYTDIMWKCGQCQNKGAFLYYRYLYLTRGIDASYRHTSYQYIDPYRWIVTPLVQTAYV